MSKGLSLSLACLLLAPSLLAAAPGSNSTDPLAAVDRNRTAIIDDIVTSFDGGELFKSRLRALRADWLLAASLASNPTALESILAESTASVGRARLESRAKTDGDANKDLVYTPVAPCRLIDTRGFGAGEATASRELFTRAASTCSVPHGKRRATFRGKGGTPNEEQGHAGSCRRRPVVFRASVAAGRRLHRCALRGRPKPRGDRRRHRRGLRR